ncbi:hypothetical protein [Pseudoxanthomonas koreensis]|uniref:hypothetical protein n=1 Tax=Pseudoxanthomonas koreensis TaxID=266061 RepID=UPI001390EDD2|nr:hypothetical protein [Pseudoxanthomonas koreensis]
MRSLKESELNMVAGGNGASTNSAARDAAIKQCRGLPDNTKVKFTIQISSNVSGKVSGVGGAATTTQTVEIETTCGELRKAA